MLSPMRSRNDGARAEDKRPSTPRVIFRLVVLSALAAIVG
jgi:hypothetical protein